jgi:hypothetical protein
VNPCRRFVNNTITISVLFAFVALLPLQPQAGTAQQTKEAADSAFSFAAYGDSRPMMYLPYKEGQPGLNKMFVELFGLDRGQRGARADLTDYAPTDHDSTAFDAC